MTEFNYCEEEMKMINETHKIFNAPNIQISPTCVRVPVLRAHSEAVNLEFSTPFPVEKAREILATSPGIELVEKLGN
jgi:aspartate-semialdehyde dehydrogenase